MRQTTPRQRENYKTRLTGKMNDAIQRAGLTRIQYEAITEQVTANAELA